jgi:hypothetical protein
MSISVNHRKSEALEYERFSCKPARLALLAWRARDAKAQSLLLSFIFFLAIFAALRE